MKDFTHQTHLENPLILLEGKSPHKRIIWNTMHQIVVQEDRTQCQLLTV